MKNFEYAAPASVDEAVAMLSDTWGETEVLAGGTDLVTVLKQRLVEPKRVVSLKQCSDLAGIKKQGDALHIGAMTTLADFIANSDVQNEFPCLHTAAVNVSAPQIINAGTVGGDLLQRPRCWYYRMGFGLLGQHNGKPLIPEGENRYHAVFGNDGPVYFVSPSSLAPGLVALDAKVQVQGPKGNREISVAELYRAPSSEDEREYTIKPNEVLTAIVIPMQGLKNGVYEVRQREGLDWPMTAAVVAYKDEDGKASDARVVLGHVAPTPWKADNAAAALNGQTVNEESAAKAGAAAAEGAKPLSGNAYKVHQIKAAVKRAALAARG